jgi:hypothetical protein
MVTNMSDYVSDILLKARVGSASFVPPGDNKAFTGIYLTTALQLVGTHKDAKSLRSRLAVNHSDYSTWESHHVLEEHDLDRLGIRPLFPDREMQFCVLIPYSAHQKRVNSVLRSENPVRYQANAEDLLRGYCEAYELIDNYTGAGASKLRRELVSIVKALFETAGLTDQRLKA